VPKYHKAMPEELQSMTQKERDDYFYNLKRKQDMQRLIGFLKKRDTKGNIE